MNKPVKELENGLLKLSKPDYSTIDKLMKRIGREYNVDMKTLHNDFVDKHGESPDSWIKRKLGKTTKKTKSCGCSVEEGTLHHWFKGSKSKGGKPGWVQADGSPCANEPGETKTPKCFSSSRLAALKRMGKKGESLIKSAVRRKRQQDPGQQQKSGSSKPTNVKTFAKGKKDPNYIKAEPGIKEMYVNEAKKDKPGKSSGKKDACYHKVKSRYSVWPSAYASGALVKCREVGAKNWGTKKEETELKEFSEFMSEAVAAWQRKAGKNPEGGLNKAGIASYRREHPGSKLSLAVTTKPSKLKKGSKKWKRRKSFCSRMLGMRKKLTSSKTARDPNSRINKSLRKWNC